MTRIVVVTSGKGGVGKTTTSASFSSALALRGFKTAVIDFDIGLRNLDLIMGCERRVVYDLVNVLNGEATLTQALIKDKHCTNDKLFVLPASQTRDKDALTEEGIERVLKELATMGATLAGHGKNPVTGEQVLNPAHTPFILAEMTMEGLYGRSGDWAYTVGLPGKSGVGGGILAVVPGVMGIAAFSPPLDDDGNSVRGQKMVASVAAALGYNLYR